MNSRIEERTCWSFLAQKAEEKIELIRLELNQTGQRLLQLQSSRERLQNMYDDYTAKNERLSQASLGMSESMMMRQFMAQLQTLIKRVDVDETHTLNLREALLEKLAECEKERVKMNTLADKNKADLLTQSRQRELNQMNEWAALQYNRNRAA
jgi:flagellar biosynthesis chaperone FliJ